MSVEEKGSIPDPAPDLRTKLKEQEVANCLKKMKGDPERGIPGKSLNAREARIMDEWALEKQTGIKSDIRYASNLKHGAAILSAQCGTRVTVADLKRIRNAGCNAFRNSRPDIPMIRKWMEDHPNVEGSKEEQLKERKLLAQINRIERENEREDEKWMPTEKVIYLADVWGAQIRSEILGLQNEAPTWSGLEPAALKDKARAFATGVLARLNKFYAPKRKPAKVGCRKPGSRIPLRRDCSDRAL